MPIYGNTKPVPGESPLERLNRLTCKCGGPDACWPFLGALRKRGRYGQFWLDSRSIPAQRAAWILQKGPLPPEIFVCHSCDWPPCVNLRHLFPATNLENLADRDRKGRQARGEGQTNARLTEADVVEILLLATTAHHGDLAARFGVRRATITNVLGGRSWSHVAPHLPRVKGKHLPPRMRCGEDHPGARLALGDVLEIRRLHRRVTQKELARRYQVSRATIQAIHYRRIWRHV